MVQRPIILYVLSILIFTRKKYSNGCTGEGLAEIG
jgi:hypothetical protein